MVGGNWVEFAHLDLDWENHILKPLHMTIEVRVSYGLCFLSHCWLGVFSKLYWLPEGCLAIETGNIFKTKRSVSIIVNVCIRSSHDFVSFWIFIVIVSEWGHSWEWCPWTESWKRMCTSNLLFGEIEWLYREKYFLGNRTWDMALDKILREDLKIHRLGTEQCIYYGSMTIDRSVSC